MSEATWLVGDVFARLADIADGSVDLVCTSPPFWMQRAYLPADHPDKALEIGQEPSPGEFVDTLLRLTAELRRVLAPHGSIAVELADTMAGSGGGGGDYLPGGLKEGQPSFNGSASAARDGNALHWRLKAAKRDQAPMSKSLCMIPEAYRMALAYGHNPLTGHLSPAGRWIVRNVVDWCRPNPTPGDDGDKFRRASSDIAIATLNPKRWWDGEAVRVAATGDTNPRNTNGPKAANGHDAGNRRQYEARTNDSGTRPLYDWWEIAPQAYSGAHYAVWTGEIARRLILAMCPERVCQVCGEPSRRIVERLSTGAGAEHRYNGSEPGVHMGERVSRTLGWTDCGHDAWRRGVVLDPFAGSGTTLSVATGLGRDAIGIDLDGRNLDLARERIGMFLTEETPA